MKESGLANSNAIGNMWTLNCLDIELTVNWPSRNACKADWKHVVAMITTNDIQISESAGITD